MYEALLFPHDIGDEMQKIAILSHIL